MSPTITEQTRKLTSLGAAIGCTDLAPGVAIEDERLAEAHEDGNARRGWKLNLRGFGVIDFTFYRWVPGDLSKPPHDHLENLNNNMQCSVCFGFYVRIEEGEGR